MSGPSAHERVKKLEARGVITGYRPVVDPSAVGLDILAFTLGDPGPGHRRDRPDAAFAAIPEIEECHHISGEADYLIKIRARDTRDLERVLRLVQATKPRVHDRDRRRVLERLRAAAAAPLGVARGSETAKARAT